MTKNQLDSKIPVISIIVPIYNIENYLERSLQSLVNQTLTKDLYEVILVDDKSTDSSLKICKKYARAYPNFRLIEMSEHSVGGCGKASNIGIKNAKGKFIGFLDSDDLASPSMFEDLLNKALATDADIIIGNYVCRNIKTGEVTLAPDRDIFKELLSEGYKFENLVDLKKLVLKLYPYPWRKLYKKEFLEKFKILFTEEDTFHEDLPFQWETTIFANDIKLIDSDLVEYSLNRVGQTVDNSNEKLRPSFYIKLLTIISFFLKRTNTYGEYKVPYANIFLNFVKKSTRHFIPDYGLFVKKASELCPSLNTNEILQLVKYRKDPITQIFFLFFLFKVSARHALLIRTLSNFFKI